jgi:hypothetical protein
MRSQNSDVSRYLASRDELCSALGKVEKFHDGIFNGLLVHRHVLVQFRSLKRLYVS